LCEALVESHLLEVLDVKEFAQPIVGFLVRFRAVQVVLVDLADLLLCKTGAIGGIFQSLPSNIATSVVELVLNDD
jgi:hypothetical protein